MITAPRLLLGLLVAAQQVPAQTCRLSVAGLNQARRVMGPVHAECPGNFVLHTAPFGNWGVTSNFGPKRNGHQFQGWCHDTTICDSLGACRTNCKDGWYEWNSCTDLAPFQPPNCSLYNSKDCTEQVSTTGANVLGTQTVDIPVRCPFDSDGDGVFDGGGCRDVASYSHGVNFMSLYELDPGGADELIQTMYFPATPVDLGCGVFGCAPAISSWAAPVSYDSPTSPPKVYAEMATIVNSGTFVNTNNACRLVTAAVATASAASLSGPKVAPASIASAFGQGLATSTAAANAAPLPLALEGTSLTITDSAGAIHPAPLYFVSPRQINYVVPASAAPGPARVAVANGSALVATGTLQVEPVVPGVFAANANGQGVAAAVALKVAISGSQTSELAFRCGPAAGSCSAVPVDLGGQTDQVYLLLFGTGIRGASGLGEISVKVGGEDCEVTYAGPQPSFPGLDQVNLRLPRALAGRGEVEVNLSAGGRPANPLRISIK